MNSEAREHLNNQMGVYLTKFPVSSGKDVKKFHMSREQNFDLKQVDRKTLNEFIRYNIQKFNNNGHWLKRRGKSGRLYNT